MNETKSDDDRHIHFKDLNEVTAIFLQGRVFAGSDLFDEETSTMILPGLIQARMGKLIWSKHPESYAEGQEAICQRAESTW